MYLFDKTKKAKALSGRTIVYVARKIGMTAPFLTQILNGTRTCSRPFAYAITKCLCQDAEVNDYFKRVD